MRLHIISILFFLSPVRSFAQDSLAGGYVHGFEQGYCTIRLNYDHTCTDTIVNSTTGTTVASGIWVQRKDSLMVYEDKLLNVKTGGIRKTDDTLYFHIVSKDRLDMFVGRFTSTYYKRYEYYSSGKLKKDHVWWMDKKAFVATTYYESDAVMETMYHNKKHTSGKFEKYNEQGQLTSKGKWKRNSKTGEVMYDAD